jgi:hypothetical protein
MCKANSMRLLERSQSRRHGQTSVCMAFPEVRLTYEKTRHATSRLETSFRLLCETVLFTEIPLLFIPLLLSRVCLPMQRCANTAPPK